ncbi:thioredoxin family protein [Flavobacterium sp. 9]|uniref:thioredoxin family protein n=1 Tax=Flavobacterium sp. 9 TaxID=2035198 RepID=UPI001E5C2662|nr:thioredoxin family protein [Flavobacterium sp. 9]
MEGYGQNNFTLNGHYLREVNKKVKLVGFNVLKDTILSEAYSDSEGCFSLKYPKDYVGAAIINIDGGDKNEITGLVVMLNHENFSLSWNDPNDYTSLKFNNSVENEVFSKGVMMTQNAEALLSGLKYLKPLYAQCLEQQVWLENEIEKQERVLPDFRKKLPVDSYSGYYLSMRKFMGDMMLTIDRYKDQLPEVGRQFRAIDFSDPKLSSSGLLPRMLSNYYVVIGNYSDHGKAVNDANAATDAVLKSLDKNIALKKVVAEYMFKQFERFNQTEYAEYLALKMLNDNSCSLGISEAAPYEQYRKMVVGKNAPDLILFPAAKSYKTLFEVAAAYKLVVFGSSWCPKCQEELPKLKEYYSDWKSKYELEIVFVSLDTEKDKYDAFVSSFPWISSCDFKGWKSKSAVDYCVFASPTMYLLDSKGKILLKPFSPNQIDVWLENVPENKI